MSRTHIQHCVGLALCAITAAHAQTLPPPPVSPTPVAKFEYDAQGNPTRTIVAPDTRNYKTKRDYDSLDRHTTTTDAKTGITQFGYDLLDQLTSVTDPRQLITSYEPTGLGDIKQLASPDTGTANSTYDAAGNLATRTDARGVLATYSYDELSRPTGVIYTRSGSTSRNMSWTYDQTGASFGAGIGRLTTATTPDTSTTFRYDDLGRVKMTVQSSPAGNPMVVNYDYDATSNVTVLTYPSGRVVTFDWANGQPTSVSITSGASTSTLLNQVVMSAFGPAQSWIWQLGGVARPHARIYDTNGRLVRHPLGVLMRDITYDDADRIGRYTHYVAATAATAPAYDQVFGYDELNRLTNVTAYTNWSYTYDANGNRTATSAGSTARGYFYLTGSNRFAPDGLSNPVRKFTYDAIGSTLTDTQTGSSSNYVATYSLEGRLTSMAQGPKGSGVDFGYDAMGRRISRKAWFVQEKGDPPIIGAITLYAYDQAHHLLGEYKADGTPLTEYVWFGDTPVAVIKPDAAAPGGIHIYAIHTDHLDTPRVILDAQGNVRWRWMGEPFGAGAAEEQPTAGLAALQQNLRFPGQQYETFGGRFYNHFRDYDPTTGRYVQSDPIGLAGGINTYAYVSANPLSYTDPLGLMGFGGGGTANHPQPNACPPQECQDVIVTTHGGVCDNNPDPMCAAGMKAAGLEGPYTTYTTKVDIPCLIRIGLELKATGGVAGEAAVRKGPAAAGGLAKKGVGVFSKQAGVQIGADIEAAAGRLASVAGSTTATVLSVSYGVAKLIEHCTCSRK